jgi:hypothetical protein
MILRTDCCRSSKATVAQIVRGERIGRPAGPPAVRLWGTAGACQLRMPVNVTGGRTTMQGARIPESSDCDPARHPLFHIIGCVARRVRHLRYTRRELARGRTPEKLVLLAAASDRPPSPPLRNRSPAGPYHQIDPLSNRRSASRNSSLTFVHDGASWQNSRLRFQSAKYARPTEPVAPPGRAADIATRVHHVRR